MLTIHKDYVIDGNGNKKAVLVPLSEWEQILEALEELDDIRTYDEVKSQASDPVPFDQAVEELKRGRSN
ncbi:MAG: hypothetical protein ABIF87_01645 [Pseudomonadota bacterium]